MGPFRPQNGCQKTRPLGTPPEGLCPLQRSPSWKLDLLRAKGTRHKIHDLPWQVRFQPHGSFCLVSFIIPGPSGMQGGDPEKAVMEFGGMHACCWETFCIFAFVV